MSLAYTVDTSLFEKQAREYQRRAITMVQISVDNASRFGASHARTHHEHTRRTGNLTSRGSLFAIPLRRTKFGAKGGFKNIAKYVRWVEFGNGPPGTRIFPKSAKALRFKIGGTVFLRKSVKVSRPFPFMGPAQEFAAEALVVDLDRKLTRVGKTFS